MKPKNWSKLLERPYLIGVLVMISVLGLHRVNLFNQLNRLGYDLMILKRGEIEQPSNVVIADIDEKSLRELGRWPWPRQTTAALFTKLSELGAKVIAFDGTFSETGHYSEFAALKRARQQLVSEVKPQLAAKKWQSVIGEFDEISQQADGDSIFSEALQASPTTNLLGFYLNFGHADGGLEIDSTELEQRLATVKRSAVPLVVFPELDVDNVFRDAPVNDLVTPIDAIANHADGFGYFNDFVDPDGTSRMNQPVHFVQGVYLPSLSLKAAAEFLDADIHLIFEKGVATPLLVSRSKDESAALPVNQYGRMFTNYYGPVGTIPYVSIIDVLRGNVDRSEIADKVVLIGSSAPGVFDLVRVPFEIVRGLKTPGVEVHATLVENIVTNKHLIESNVSYLILLLAIPILLIVVLSRSGPMTGLVLTALLALGEVFFSYFLLISSGYVCWVAIPLVMLFLIYTAMTLAKYQAEQVQKRFIKRAFGHYLSPAMVNQIVDDPDRLNLSGERKELSILFSDIRGFTTLSEKLTPTALRDLLAAYLTPMTKIITEGNRGTLDKYIGDAIMAFFGAPLDLKDHAKCACMSAVQMNRQLKLLRADANFPPIDIGVGINTGDVSVGNMGSEAVFDYTALGDVVNLASRLEGITKQYGVQSIVNQSTMEKCEKDFCFRELDRIQVKGKEEPATIYQLVDTHDAIDDEMRELLGYFNDGLDAYRQRDWEVALERFDQCLRIDPTDGPAKVFTGRCNQYQKESPPVDWKGVHRFTQK